MNKKIDTKVGIILIAALAVIVAYLSFSYSQVSFSSLSVLLSHFLSNNISETTLEIKKFSSEEDFKDYLQKAQLSYYGGLDISLGGARAKGWGEISLAVPTASEGLGGGDTGVPERVSETTVQVAGIDEPDIVKTDGKEIYFSPQSGYYLQPVMWEESIMPPYRSIEETKAIKAFPPNDLAIDGKIDKRGDLLLSKNILTIFSYNKVYGYDVSDPKNPKEKWNISLESRNSIAGVRLYKDKIYLITQTQVDTYHPCPIRPLSVGGTPLEIKCVDIYHPTIPISVDVTYTGMILNPESGKIEKTVSLVGSSASSLVYMSPGAIYLTYSYNESIIKFFSNFFKEKCQDLFPAWFIGKMEKLDSYDISDAAKMTEFEVIFEQYKNSLSDDERIKTENEITNRMSDYYKDHKRELEKTGIVKIALDGFNVKATGSIPGHPLNQFSLDEYNNYLRVATTIGENWGWIGGISTSSGGSANDVYVLDKDLKIEGSVKDLGLTERIYSARFIEDKGYLVTFRQTDPFYVLDLSNPRNPELKGELKIPGYSSYLHPITKDKILGIGKEGSQVKISLFDVKDPKNPTEAAKYVLNEYWSDILNTHHAFLLDTKHEIFFLPGSGKGYIFSYKDNKLELKRAVSSISAKRAIYINDYLYIIGDNKIVVLNEINWEKTNELEF